MFPLKEVWSDIVVPSLVGFAILGLMFGIIRGIMYIVSHVWLGISL